jgi:hypothetical protein
MLLAICVTLCLRYFILHSPPEANPRHGRRDTYDQSNWYSDSDSNLGSRIEATMRRGCGGGGSRRKRRRGARRLNVKARASKRVVVGARGIVQLKEKLVDSRYDCRVYAVVESYFPQKALLIWSILFDGGTCQRRVILRLGNGSDQLTDKSAICYSDDECWTDP